MTDLDQLKGTFIVLEGIDGSGKTTLGVTLHDMLSRFYGLETILTREPGGTPLRNSIRDIVRYTEMDQTAKMMLFCAERIHHCQKVIFPALRSDKVVICDRYAYSTFAYQPPQSKFERDLIFSSAQAHPNFVFFLDVSPEVAKERIEKRDEKHPGRPRDVWDSASLESMSNIQQNYKNLIGIELQSEMKDDPYSVYRTRWYTLDASRETPDVAWQAIQYLIEYCLG